MILVHGHAADGRHTRRWNNQKQLVDDVKARSLRTTWCGHGGGGGGRRGGGGRCKPLKVVVKAMEGLSFCGQAQLFAASKVVITHHGASLANGLFLRPHSLMVEMNKQWKTSAPGDNGLHFAPTFDNAGCVSPGSPGPLALSGARLASPRARRVALTHPPPCPASSQVRGPLRLLSRRVRGRARDVRSVAAGLTAERRPARQPRRRRRAMGDAPPRTV